MVQSVEKRDVFRMSIVTPKNKLKWLGAIVGLAGLAACTTSGVPSKGGDPNFIRVTDPTAFSASFVDRRIEDPENPEVWFQFNSDGTMVGTLRRGAIDGTWEFKDGYWCREFEAGGKASAYDCQTVELSGNLGRFTRERGKGDGGVYALK